MNYSIKAYIKACDETVSSVAARLNLSRPTFDTYISLFETGFPIPKERYQSIFEQLFQDEPLPPNIFKERLVMCSSYSRRNKDYKEIKHVVSQSDRMSRLLEKIHTSLENKLIDDDALDFLDLFVSEYSNDQHYALGQAFLHEDSLIEIERSMKLRELYFSYYNHMREVLASERDSKRNIGVDFYSYYYENSEMGRKKPTANSYLSQYKKARRELNDNKNW